MKVRALVILLAHAGCGGAPASAPRPEAPAPVEPSAARAASVTCKRLDYQPLPAPDDGVDVPNPEVEDPKHALARFHDRLAALARKKRREPVRIAFYGDSNMTRDFISGGLRQALQERHGDAGHGYVAIGKPWSWYQHRDIEHGVEPKAWRSFAVSTHAVLDDTYGHAGIAAQSISDGARAWIHTGKTRASRADVFYLLQPRGGAFELVVDGKELGRIDTAASELALGFRSFELEDAPHKLRFAASIGTRLLGVALERSEPGIVVDSLGVGGVKVEQLARMRENVAQQALEKRRYDLILILTGATEDDTDRHDVALAKLLALHRRALPESACLVMSPPDFAYGSAMRPRPSKRIVRLGKRKRRVALESGCAFWDFHAAMGGELSIVRFLAKRLAEPDLSHLSPDGAQLMGRRLAAALSADFRAHLDEHPDAGCSP